MLFALQPHTLAFSVPVCSLQADLKQLHLQWALGASERTGRLCVQFSFCSVYKLTAFPRQCHSSAPMTLSLQPPTTDVWKCHVPVRLAGGREFNNHHHLLRFELPGLSASFAHCSKSLRPSVSSVTLLTCSVPECPLLPAGTVIDRLHSGLLSVFQINASDFGCLFSAIGRV